jgi:hypothetical protein
MTGNLKLASGMGVSYLNAGGAGNQWVEMVSATNFQFLGSTAPFIYSIEAATNSISFAGDVLCSKYVKFQTDFNVGIVGPNRSLYFTSVGANARGDMFLLDPLNDRADFLCPVFVNNVPVVMDALSDGTPYVRKDGAWLKADPPLDGVEYTRKDGTWVPSSAATGAFLPLTGGTVNGTINMTGASMVRQELGGGDGQTRKIFQAISGYGGEAAYQQIKYINGTSAEFWWWSDNNWSDTSHAAASWAMHTTAVNGQYCGLDVNGTLSSSAMMDRGVDRVAAVKADAACKHLIRETQHGDGIDLGELVVTLLARIKILEAKVAECCG